MKTSSFSARSVQLRSFLLAALTASSLGAVGTRQFVLESAKDFEGGELRGVALDSEGSLRPGLNLRAYPVQEAPAVWAVLVEGDGVLLATGNEGKLLRVTGGRTELVADTEALALTSIVRAFGRVFVGSMPGGVIYELKNNQLKEFVKLPGEPHIFALAFDEKSQALYAATGPEGKLFRLNAAGQASVYFDSEQEHLISVTAREGVVYAGSSGAALLYKIEGPGRAQVLYDFEKTEVRAIAVDKQGAVYAIANELKSGSLPDAAQSGQSSSPQTQRPAKGKGVLYRFSKTGLPEELLTQNEEHFVSLHLDDQERPLVGSGAEGRLSRIEENHKSITWADVDERQLAFAQIENARGWLVGSDPVVVYRVEGLGGDGAIYQSPVLDAGLRARFGRFQFDAEGAVELSTRTGNTKEPDSTWSDWSAGSKADFLVKSPAGRYFQFRARMPQNQQSVLRRVETSFVTDNLRALVQSVKVESSSRKSNSKGPEKSGGPVTEKPSSTLSLSWTVDNPDADELRYRVQYQPVQSKTWFDALKPDQVLTENKYSWDTASLPEGRYRIRVTATDELANPPDRVTSHSLESGVFLVDNTPPIFEGLRVEGRQVRGRVKDGVGPIRRIEIQQAGQEPWIPFEPSDGIFDQAEESFTADLNQVFPAGPLLITVRAFDSAGNSVVQHLRLEK